MESNQKKHTYKVRSEEVQEILSRPPFWIVRWGSGIAVFFMVVLLVIAWIVPSPTMIQTSLKIAHQSFAIPPDAAESDTSFVAVAKLSQENFGKIKTGQKVVIKLNAYSDRDFGVLKGKVVWLSDKFDEERGYFDVLISLPKDRKTSRGYQVQYIPAMLGQADIIVSERKLIQKLSPF
jgi:hypothetical protein